MTKTRLLSLIILIGVFGFSLNWAISSGEDSERENRKKVDTRIDNSYYWVEMAEKGYIDFNSEMKAPSGIYTGSKINARGVLTDDSPDVPVTEINSTQSENSVFVDPNNPDVVLNSNNSTQNPVGSLYGANDFHSFDASESWEGQVEGAGGGNSGDPTTAIGLNGRWYVNFISSPGGMGISYSDDQGASWTAKTVAPNPGSLADKNHMWIDNSTTSAYEGNIYIAWTNFGGSNDSEIAISYSSDDGDTWTTNNNISGAVSAGSHNQGVNLSVGPDGEVYAIWAIYDSWPSDESAIGMAKSLDGGVTWEPAVRAVSNTRGIRNTETGKNMRVNSFPGSTVDISNSADRGALYITWANVGTPGINTGSDIDVYVVKSSDGGATFGEAVRVNQDEAGLGKEHYFPWITSDPANGILSVVFYDDRNVNSNQAEAFCANSDDGGATWEDFKVSDVSFTPSPIPGLAGSYFGDYLGVIAQDGWVYPVWTDNRTGTAMTYCSPYQTNPLNRPKDLVGVVTFETGAVDLIWTYEEAENFLGFNVYRDGTFLVETTDTTYIDNLPDYGIYTYQVTAFYTDDMESGASGTSVQWGDAHITVEPLSLSVSLPTEEITTRQLTVINTGELELVYNITPFVDQSKKVLEYCEGSGGGDEYISMVEVGDISNTSGEDGYADYTDQSTLMQVGEPYEITVTNGNSYSSDQCGIWIDWDQNGEFDDEEIQVLGTPGHGPYTATITPPVGSVSGQTTMRVRIIFTGDLDPCGTTTYGEVEDYAINVQGWLGIDPMAGVIPAGDTNMVEVTFDSHDMAEGLYSATAIFTHNDPMAEDIEVDISFLISSMMVNATSDKEGVCLGDEANITTEVLGLTEPLVYSWTSMPEGFVSDMADITVSPEVSTWYYISVSDAADNVVTDSVMIAVYELPVNNLGDDQTLCGQSEYPLDAGNEGSTYLWSTGEETQTIVATASGETVFWVDVTTVNECTVRDSVSINFAATPIVDLGEDATVCNDGSTVLDAANEGATYMWSTGEESQTITPEGEGMIVFWVDVTNNTGCVARDSISLTFAQMPVVDLGADTVLCGGIVYTLDAGNEGSTYLWSTEETTQTIDVDTTAYGYGERELMVTVTNSDLCSSSDAIVIDFVNCTGIGENEANLALSIFPNPSNGLINLDLNSLKAVSVDIKITNINGQVVFNETNVMVDNNLKKQINLNTAADGIYTVFIKADNYMIEKKIVIRK